MTESGRHLSAGVRGTLTMVLATALLTSMHAVVRHLSAGMHPFEITFFRNLFGLLAVAPLMLRAGPAGLVMRQPRLHLLRGTTGILAMLSWFYGLSVIPIAEATALSFTSAIFGSICAVVLLGERMRARRWTAVAVGFAGTLIILRPGAGVMAPGALIVLFSSVCWGLSLVFVKRLLRTDSVVCVVAWNAVLLTVLSLPTALAVWVTPTMDQLAWLVLVGILATGGHLAMTTAFSLADATAVFPVDFTRLIWASVLGFVAFAEVPDLWTWVGGSIIFASTAYITFREAQGRRRASL